MQYTVLVDNYVSNKHINYCEIDKNVQDFQERG